MTAPNATRSASPEGYCEWEISERELMEAANAAIFYNRPDLQFKFDASAPPLIPANPRQSGD